MEREEMKKLYFDCPTGASGDMLAASLLDLLDDPEKIIEQLNNLNLEDAIASFADALEEELNGKHFNVEVDGQEEISEDVPEEEVEEERMHHHEHSCGEPHRHHHRHHGRKHGRCKGPKSPFPPVELHLHLEGPITVNVNNPFMPPMMGCGPMFDKMGPCKKHHKRRHRHHRHHKRHLKEEAKQAELKAKDLKPEASEKKPPKVHKSSAFDATGNALHH